MYGRNKRLVFLAAIVVLVGGIIWGALIWQTNSRKSQAVVGVEDVKSAIQMFYEVHGWYPKSPANEEFLSEYIMRWNATVERSSGARDLYRITCTEGPAAGRSAWFRYVYRGENEAPAIQWEEEPDE